VLSLSSNVEIASHVFVVEFHVYIFHLLDVLPDYDLPKLSGANSGWATLELEDVDVQITKDDGTIQKYQVMFPKRFTSVLDFYVFNTEAIFFPSYEYHILSPNGVTLKNAILQSSNQSTVTTYIPELMLNIELSNLRTIKWRTAGGNSYTLELTDVIVSRSLMPTQSVPLSERKPKYLQSGIDLRPLCPTIRNQGDLGTCGAAAVTSFLEFVTGTRWSILYLYYVTRVFICNTLPHDDAGVELKDLLEAMRRYGICKDESWPYDTTKFLEAPPESAMEEARMFRPQLSDFRPLHSLEDMKATLKKEMPLFVDINFAPIAYGREPAATGKVGKPPVQEVEYCDHTLIIVGYNDETEELIFQNSWGTDWGEQGFGYFSYEYINAGLFKNAYTWRSNLKVE